jgi:integrase
MKHLPFSVFKRSGRRFYSVKFKNKESGEYLPAVSTGQETEVMAIATAFQWLKDGIPRKGETIPFRKYSLRDMAREADLTAADGEYICGELQRRGLLKSYVLADSEQAVTLEGYLSTFWDFENSPYVREKLRKNHGIHRYYCKAQSGAVNGYWIPFFKGRLLGDIGKRDVGAFIDSLDSGEKKLSAARKNHIIKAGTIPLKWAFHKEMIGRDITAGITWFAGKAAERQILTPELAAAVFRVEWTDPRTRLANLTAAVTGMRAGELQGLRVQDLGRDCLYIRHSWNCRDGLKSTKNNEERVVEVFPRLIGELLNLAQSSPHGVSIDSYVFWAELSPGKPIEEKLFVRDLRMALVKTGMNKETAKTYCFHGWRHTYSTYMRERINDKLLQSQTGHKTIAMLDHYSEHRKEGDRKRIQEAQKEVYGALIPSAPYIEAVRA